jgi:CRISPR-associated protein (TIGR03986 family)
MVWVDDTGTFTNPYNFVSLGRECSRGRNYCEIRNRADLKTGYIEITLTTKTPLFIPNTTNADFFGVRDPQDPANIVKSYDFFSYRDNTAQNAPQLPLPEPIIPGSSIRGMIRSAFEAVTNSCLSTLDSERLMYKRTSNYGEPGRLRKVGTNNWNIEPHEAIKVNKTSTIYPVFLTCEEGQRVFIQIAPNHHQKKGHNIFRLVSGISITRDPAYPIEGFIHHGEPFQGKHFETIMVRTPGASIPGIRDYDVERLLENIKLYNDDTVNIHKRCANPSLRHSGYAHLQRFRTIHDLDGALIYYRKAGNFYYMSPASVSREVFHKRLKNVVRNFTPCTDKTDLCAGCAVFGMVQGSDSVSSRLRFTDAKPDTNQLNFAEYFESVDRVYRIVLKELSSPKPSAAEFYLKQPDQNATNWNYDYMEPENLIPNYKAEINGRKFYWHRYIETCNSVSHNGPPTERNVAIRPVKRESRFKSRIFFNDITENELNRIIWVLRPAGAESTHYHKLGMGKPLGLGSVRIDVTDVKFRQIRLNASEQTIDYHWQDFPVSSLGNDQARSLMGCSIEVLREFLNITDFNLAPNNCEYPSAKDRNSESTIFNWFAGNKQHRAGLNCQQNQRPNGTGFSHVIHNPLPDINDGNCSLPKYREIVEQGRR